MTIHGFTAAPIWAACLVLSASLGLGCVTVIEDVDAQQSRREAAARRNVGIDYLAKGRTALAIRELAHAKTLDPKDPKTLLWLGEAHRRRGRLEEARGYMESAVTLDPGYHDARLNLSGLLILLKRYPASIEHAQELLDDPTYEAPWRAYNNLGWAELQQGRYAEAKDAFEHALDFYQNYWPARLNLGILALEEGRQHEAIAEFTRILDRSPAGAAVEANYHIAVAYVSLGEAGEALAHFESVMASDPESSWAKQSQDYLESLR
ncbi:MAG: tetratricopeptide repeat protein [Myxococcota bacterium]